MKDGKHADAPETAEEAMQMLQEIIDESEIVKRQSEAEIDAITRDDMHYNSSHTSDKVTGAPHEIFRDNYTSNVNVKLIENTHAQSNNEAKEKNPKTAQKVINVIAAIMTVVPLVYIGLPWWVNIIVILAIWSLPTLGGLLMIAAWAWSFVIMLNSPFSFFTVIYLVVFIAYFIVSFIPSVMILINLLKKK